MRNAQASVNAILIKGKVSICCFDACSKVVHTRFLVLELSLAFALLLWTIPKHLATSPGIFQDARKIVARGTCGKCVWQTDSDIYLILCIAVCISRFSFRSFSLPMKKTAPLATLTTTRGSFLESPDNKRRAVVVYIQDRGINSFANNMIKLSATGPVFLIWIHVFDFGSEKLARL